MTQNFIVFLNSDTIISASIFGYIDSDTEAASHMHHAESQGLVNKLHKLYENDIYIGYISTVAEKEARGQIGNAINAVINLYWRNRGLSQADKEKWADAITSFRRQANLNLDECLYMLTRDPISTSKIQKLGKTLRAEFNKLDEKYKHNLNYHRQMLKGNPTDFRFPDMESHRPDIEDSDLCILSEGLLVKNKLKKDTYLVAIDGHMTCKWPTEMLQNKFGLLIKKPDKMIHIIDKKYGHIVHIA